jgi:hypothetical protein
MIREAFKAFRAGRLGSDGTRSVDIHHADRANTKFGLYELHDDVLTELLAEVELSEGFSATPGAWTIRLGGRTEVIDNFEKGAIRRYGEWRATGAGRRAFQKAYGVQAAANADGISDDRDITLEEVRRSVVRTVQVRRGQAEFRAKLIKVYEGRCAISGCNVVDALEAAHIYPVNILGSHDLANGLLLRADIHLLFDLNLIRIDPTTRRVSLHRRVTDEAYAPIADVVVKPGIMVNDRRFGQWLANRRSAFGTRPLAVKPEPAGRSISA